MPARLVLLIEPLQDNREIYAVILAHHGVHVLEAEDGEAGLRLAREHRPEIVILNTDLPKLDGIEVVRRLKADPETAATRTIILTATASEDMRQRAFAAGADDYLVKPLAPTELLTYLREHLGD